MLTLACQQKKYPVFVVFYLTNFAVRHIMHSINSKGAVGFFVHGAFAVCH